MLFAPAEKARNRGYILRDRTMRKEGGALHDKANLAAHLNNIGSGKLNALNVYVTGVRNIQLINHPLNGCFSAPAGANESAQFAAINHQIKAANSRMRAAGVGLANIIEFNHKAVAP